MEQLTRALEAFGLPTSLPDGASAEGVVELSRRDKKREAGARRMVLPLSGGDAGLFDVNDEELLAAIAAA